MKRMAYVCMCLQCVTLQCVTFVNKEGGGTLHMHGVWCGWGYLKQKTNAWDSGIGLV